MSGLALICVCACSNPEVEPPIDESLSAEPVFILLDAYKGNEPDFAKLGELTEPFPLRWSDHIIEMFGDYVF